MIPHMLVMALDVGTSSARALCFDASGRPVPGAEGRVAYDAITGPDGAAELDPATLLEAVASAIDGCLAGAGPRSAQIQAVGALSHSRVWASIVTDALGVPLWLSSAGEASARGAALVALAGDGVPAPPPLPIGRPLHPSPRRHALYLGLPGRQERLYDNIGLIPPLLRE